MKVILSPRAEKELKKLSKTDQIAVAKKIRSIRDSKQGLNEEKLAGFRSIFRIRVGNFRILYRKTAAEIYIILIAHRRDVYQLLQQLFR